MSIMSPTSKINKVAEKKISLKKLKKLISKN